MGGNGSGPRKREKNIHPDDEPLTNEDLELFDFLEHTGGAVARIYVYRIPPNGDSEWVATLTVDTLKDNAEEYLRDNYGPSKYQLKFKGTDGRFVTTKTLKIGAVNSLVPHAGVVGVPGVGDPRIDFMLAQARDDRALTMKLIETLATRGNNSGPPPSDPAAMLTAVVTAFSVLKASSDPANPNAGGGNMVKQLRDVMEIVREAKELNGGDGGDTKPDSWPGLVRDLGKQLLGGGGIQLQPAPSAVRNITAGANFRVAPVNNQPGGPGPARPTGGGGMGEMRPHVAGETGAPAVDEQQSGEAHQQNVVRWIQAGLDYLKQKAKLGKPVNLYQDLIFDHKEEPQFAAILQAIQQGATFEHLLAFDTEIANDPTLRQWFQSLYDSVHKEIFEPDDPGGPGGNPDNPGANGADGAGGGPHT